MIYHIYISFLFLYSLRDRKLDFWNCSERWKNATLGKQEWQHDAEKETYENLTSLRAAICSGSRCISLSYGVPSNRSGRIRSVPPQFPSFSCCFLVRSGHSGTRFGRSISQWIRQAVGTESRRSRKNARV